MNRLFRALRARPIAALLALHLALTGTGIPCLIVCTAAAAEANQHAASCHESTDADHHDSCPDDSPCVRDQALALAPQIEASDSPQDAGLAIAFVDVATIARPLALHGVHQRAMPDRSPPFPPGFDVLRI
jgi:hypothetical protein